MCWDFKGSQGCWGPWGHWGHAEARYTSVNPPSISRVEIGIIIFLLGYSVFSCHNARIEKNNSQCHPNLGTHKRKKKYLASFPCVCAIWLWLSCETWFPLPQNLNGCTYHCTPDAMRGGSDVQRRLSLVSPAALDSPLFQSCTKFRLVQTSVRLKFD